MTKQSSRRSTHERDYSGLLVKLLSGFVYREDQRYWDQLMLRQENVRAYFETIGLYLHLDDTDGYAFLRSLPVAGEAEEEGAEVEAASEEVTTLRLMRKMPLTFDVSLLCVLIREALENYDAKVSDDHRLILTRTEIYEMLREFMTDTTDEAKQQRRFDAMINKVVDLGFLRELKTDAHRVEVRRSIKALVDAKKITEIKAEMERGLGRVQTDEGQSEVLQ
jgi:hypothetical protein